MPHLNNYSLIDGKTMHIVKDAWPPYLFVMFVFLPARIASQNNQPFDPQNLSIYQHMDRYSAKLVPRLIDDIVS
ncbi:hypothetical protein V9T40_004283 [Parthenolecanium corni]|uniref:Uncharacterized protein n=1 Tax=Parthenolecanium corni TaxID=536013 RepID=A0AAN9YAW3_9HEMI